MKAYIFTDQNRITKDCYQQEKIKAVLQLVAKTTDTTT